MSISQTLTEAMIRLISLEGVPLRVVAIAGEVISLDAALCDNKGISPNSFDGLASFFDAYESLLEEASRLIENHQIKGDNNNLSQGIDAILSKLKYIGDAAKSP